MEISTNNTESYYNECVGDKALEVLGTLDVKFLCGAIAGDMIGSVYEFASFKKTDFISSVKTCIIPHTHTNIFIVK